MTGDAPTIVFAAGGTGGHIYPALAVAQALRAARPNAQIAFLCSDRPIDARVMSATDELWTPTPAKPFGVRPRALARFLWNWGRSLRASRSVLRGADALIVTGGFVSAPAARAARIEGVPVVLLNLDAVPGKASRLVAHSASVVLTSSHSDTTPASWERLPPIVRAALLDMPEPGACRTELGLDPGTKTLLVTGGSQGARSLNNALIDALERMPDAFYGWQALHQAGEGDEIGDRLKAAYDGAGVKAVVTPFVERMDLAWHAADLAITRGGAGAVAEAWATRTPAVFLPYPFHADDHQKANARPLIEAKAAHLVDDLIEPERTRAALAPLLRELLASDQARSDMKRGYQSLGPCDGAQRVASRVLALIEPSPA